jgi:uncharacterized membrane protein
METTGRTSHVLFASGMIGMGLVGLYFGDFASVAQEFPKWVPGRSVILYAAAALMVVGGIGLLFRRSAALSSRVLFFYTALWALLLNVPIVVKAPLIEVNYQGLGEIMVILAGAWVLFAAAFPAPRAGAPMSFAFGNRGTRFAQIVFGLAALPLGLAHFFYLANTAPLVPSWLPYHTAWAYLTGAAQIVAGFAVLISVVPRLAAMLDAVLLTLFTFLVWPPLMIGKPPSSDMWSEITVSWAISAAAFVVAASIRAKKTTTVV